MKKLFNLFTILLTSALVPALTSCSNANVLVIAMSPDYPPFQFIDSSRPSGQRIVGADVELSKFIAKHLGMELQILPMRFNATLAAVQIGRADLAISGFSWTEERAKNFLLSDSYRPYSDGFEGLLVREGSEAASFTSLEQFNNSNVTVAAQLASIQLSAIEGELPNANHRLIRTIDEGVMLLNNGDVDAIAIYSAMGGLIEAQNENLVMMDESISFIRTDGNLHVIGKIGNSELMNRVNEAIALVVEENKFAGWFEDALLIASAIQHGL